MVDVCGRIYLSDGVFARAASVPFAHLVTRFLDNEAMQAYILKFARFALTTLVSRALDPAQLPDFEQRKRSSEKCMHLGLLKWVVQLSKEDLNTELALVLTTINGEFRSVAGTDFPEMKALLTDIGYFPLVPVVYTETEPVAAIGAVADKQEVTRKSASSPHLRVLGDIEKVKQQRRAKETQKKEAELQLAKEKEQRTRVLRMQLEMRRVEQGLSRGIVDDGDALYPFDSTGQAPIEEFQVREFTSEENEESEMVKIVSRKYFRVLKTLFQKYSGTGFAVRKEFGSSFQWMAERKAKLTEAELVKILSLFKVVPSLMSKEDVKSVLKGYNAKIAHQHDLTSVDFDGFTELMAQLAYFACSKGSGVHWPAAIQFKQFMMYVRENCGNQGIALDLFDEPDPGAGDKDVTRRLNELLRSNPEMRLPVGYRLSMDQDVAITYVVPAVLPVSRAVSAALEVLDSVLHTALNLHFLECQAQIVSHPCAKGLKQPKATVSQQGGDKSPEIFPQHVLSAVLKFEVARASEELQQVAYECAQTLENMLLSVSLGLTRVINRSTSRRHLVKLPQIAEQELAKARDKESWQRRMKEVQARMMKNMQEKRARQVQEQETEKQRKLTELIEAKKLAERSVKEKEARNRALKQWYERKQQEKAKITEGTEAEQHTIDRKKREKDASFKNLRLRLQEVLKAKQEQWKSTHEQAKSQSARLLDKSSHQLLATKLLEMSKETTAQKQAKAKELKNFSESTEVQAIFQNSGKQIRAFFQFFLKKVDFRIENESISGLRLSDYAKMSVDVGIVPDLLTPELNATVFKAVTKVKSGEHSKSGLLEEPDLREVLVQVTDLARDKLNTLAGTPGTQLDAGTLTALVSKLRLNASLGELASFLKDSQDQSHRPKRLPAKRNSVASTDDFEGSDPPLKETTPLRSAQLRKPLRSKSAVRLRAPATARE